MPYTRDRRDRGKALLLVVGLHVALGALLIAGLAGPDIVRRVQEPLAGFDLTPPEPEPPPPPAASSPAARNEAGAAGRRARAAPVVVPDARPLQPSPVRTAEEAGTGSDARAGAADAGSGRGAGGDGSGLGGGGTGGAGIGLGREASYIPGSATSRLPAAILATAPSRVGRLPLRVSITPAGRVGSCAPLGTTGSPVLDDALCRSVTAYSRWVPALDRQGRPVTVELVFTATWRD